MKTISNITSRRKPGKKEVWKFINHNRISTLLVFLILVGGTVIHSVAYAQGNPSVVGEWSSIISWPQVAVHMHVLPTGKVMTWAGAENNDPRIGYGDYEPYIWDPDTGAFTEVESPDFTIFCSGHSFLPDGRLLVSGGGVDNEDGVVTTDNSGKAALYNPWTNLWEQVPDMNGRRYYGTDTTLSNGNVLVISGAISSDVRNKVPQVFDPVAWNWRSLTNAKLWLELYPWMFQAPNGKVFMAGPRKATSYLNTTGTGSWTDVALRKFGVRRNASAVMYDTGKVLAAGGLGGSKKNVTATAEVIDLNAPTPAWRYVSSMSRRRHHLNLTLLPDGEVLVTGGTSGLVGDDPSDSVCSANQEWACSAEMWSPVTEKFTTMASTTEPRLYHSTAALLPDGRVLVAGGNFHPTAEIYSPPYLFKGDRPVITLAPLGVTYGQKFFVGTLDPTQITQVTWIRLSSVTHSFNENQRISRPSFRQVAGGLNVTAPSNPNLCPPGYYMMFILNSKGVPSVAKIIQIT